MLNKWFKANKLTLHSERTNFYKASFVVI